MTDQPRLIEHIGILVPNLEEAIERWSAALGYTFSPIVRYRTELYADHTSPEPHFHDARLSFSREGPPRLELMEATGEGTHALSEAGVHHLGIFGVVDLDSRREELAALGIGEDGVSLADDGQTLLAFTEKSSLDGVRIEHISPLTGRLVADDGSPLWMDPATGRHSVWGPPKD